MLVHYLQVQPMTDAVRQEQEGTASAVARAHWLCLMPCLLMYSHMCVSPSASPLAWVLGMPRIISCG